MPTAGENTQMIARLVVGLESLTTAVDVLREDLRNHGRATASTTTQVATNSQAIKDIRDDVGHMAKLVRDGNGQPSLTERLTRLETGQSETTRRFDELSRAISELRSCIDNVETTKIVSRGQVVAGVSGMVATAVLSLGAILAQLFRP